MRPHWATEELREELEDLPGLIESAALLGDSERFVKLQMRQVALEARLADERIEPLRAAVERIEAQLRELDWQRDAALNGPPPEVPEHQRGFQTPQMQLSRRLQSLAAQSARLSRELKVAKATLEEEVARGRTTPMTTTT